MAGGSKGIGAGLKLDSSVAVLTDVSSWLRGINGGTDPQRLDDTTLQPDIANPTKSEIAGFTSRSLSLTVLYSAAAFTFFAAIEGMNALNYQFGPNGFTAGDQKISGLANVLSVSLPSPTTENVQEFTVEIVRTTQVVGTF